MKTPSRTIVDSTTSSEFGLLGIALAKWTEVRIAKGPMSNLPSHVSDPGSIAPTRTMILTAGETEGRIASGLNVFLFATILLLIAAIPLVAYPVPPLEDYANHLARMQVIATISHNANLARFYEIDWEVVPNLLMDMVVPVFARVMNIYAAGQLFMAMIFVLVVSGVSALHRVLFGRWSLVPLAVCPLLYNYIFLIGVLNYQAGIGVALWALTSWVALRERGPLVRYAVACGFVILLFLCHLFALGVYGIGVLAFETSRLMTPQDTKWWRRLVGFVLAGFQFLPAIPLLLLSPTWSNAADFAWEEEGKIDGLMYVFRAYSDMVALSIITAFVVGTIMAARAGLLKTHRLLYPLLIFGGLIYFALPRTLFATYMADQRLPIAIALFCGACIRIDLRQRRVRHAFLALASVLLVVRVAEVNVVWSDIAPGTLEFRNSVRKVAVGSRVLVAYADASGGDNADEFGLVHAACLAILERSALVTTAFTVSGKQIMHVRPEFRHQVDTEDGTPPTMDELLVATTRPSEHSDAYWNKWVDEFDYLYVLFTEDEAANPAPDLLTLVQGGDHFQLYKIRRTQTGAVAH
jgi:hypothetical protein